MKKTLKFLHEIGTVGVMGAALILLVLSLRGDGLEVAAFAEQRALMRDLGRWVYLPSLLLVMTSGTLAIAFHRPFQNADWALLKAFMTPLLLEGSFLAVLSPGKTAMTLSAELAAGDGAVVERLARALYLERAGLIVMLVLFGAQIWFAVWRPRLRKKHRPSAASTRSTAPGPSAADSAKAPAPGA